MPILKRRTARKHTGQRRAGLPVWTHLSRSPLETDRVGRRIGRCLQGGETLALYGELGSGKTALVRGIAAGLGAQPAEVSSPTFVFIHEYHGRCRLAHADLYRIESPSELQQLGLSEYDDGMTVIAIEWAEKAGIHLPTDRLDIRLSHQSPTTRRIAMTATGPVAQRLLTRLKTTRGAHGRTQRKSRAR